jgi:hypothetical protein
MGSSSGAGARGSCVGSGDGVGTSGTGVTWVNRAWGARASVCPLARPMVGPLGPGDRTEVHHPRLCIVAPYIYR